MNNHKPPSKLAEVISTVIVLSFVGFIIGTAIGLWIRYFWIAIVFACPCR